jgi:integral membrane protein
MGNKVLKVLWMGLGFLSVGVGVIGIVVPGLPTTVFFVIAAACFSRSSPRFEAWVLNLPTIGPMVRDYRAGLGMPKQAKVAAITSIVVVCSASAFFAVDRIWIKAAILGSGAVGVAWILWRVPTRTAPLPPNPDAPGRPLSTAGRIFRLVAFAEAFTWLALLAGMFQKYVIDAGETGVKVFGRVHGVVVLVYFAVAVLVGLRQRWSSKTMVYALLASVPPLATIVFERWAYATGRLDRR